jgi:hypothetical protein
MQRRRTKKVKERSQLRIRFGETTHRPALQGCEDFVGSGWLSTKRVERRVLGHGCGSSLSRKRDWTTDHTQQPSALNRSQRYE